MNNPKHTKGPWRHHGEIINSHEREIAIIPNFSSKRDKANARLIAAAPELLEALDKLVTRVANDEKISKHDEGLHRCIALIRKATGESNE